MSSENLDQLAWDYLMGSPRDQAESGHILAYTGAAAIFPLLRAGLRALQEFNPLRTPGVANPDHQVAESTWVYQIAEPTLESMYAVVNQIGQPASDALCRALWEPGELFKLMACLILFNVPHPNRRTVRGIRDWWAVNVGVDLQTLDQLTIPTLFRALDAQTADESDQRYFRDGGAVMMLSTLLARGGDPRFQELQRDFYRESDVSLAEGDERTRNTALLYLVRHEPFHV